MDPWGRLRRFGYVLAAMPLLLGFGALFLWAGMPSETDLDGMRLISASVLASTAVVTGAVAGWRRLRGRSVRGVLLLGGWVALASAAAAGLAELGLPVDDRGAVGFAFTLGLVCAGVLLLAGWFAWLVVRETVGWAREERERGESARRA